MYDWLLTRNGLKRKEGLVKITVGLHSFEYFLVWTSSTAFCKHFDIVEDHKADFSGSPDHCFDHYSHLKRCHIHATTEASKLKLSCCLDDLHTEKSQPNNTRYYSLRACQKRSGLVLWMLWKLNIKIKFEAHKINYLENNYLKKKKKKEDQAHILVIKYYTYENFENTNIYWNNT